MEIISKIYMYVCVRVFLLLAFVLLSKIHFSTKIEAANSEKKEDKKQKKETFNQKVNVFSC